VGSFEVAIATLNEATAGRGQHRKYLPCAFTEHGAIMAATILSSPRAVEVSVYVVRAFVRLRKAAQDELHRRQFQLPVGHRPRAGRHASRPGPAAR
jgi:hypothetical protein